MFVIILSGIRMTSLLSRKATPCGTATWSTESNKSVCLIHLLFECYLTGKEQSKGQTNLNHGGE